MNLHSDTCSCGVSDSHVIAKRRTSDNYGVHLWCDAKISGPLAAIRGVPRVQPATVEARQTELRAGWLFMGELSLYSLDELPKLYEACRWAARQDGLPATVRARFEVLVARKLRPTWTVVSTDRDGRPTARYWRVHRLLSSDLAVWDYVSEGASGGRYEVMRVLPKDRRFPGSDEACRPTGIRFSRLDDVLAFVRSEIGR